MKIDLSDAGDILREYIDRIEQLEADLTRTQNELAAWKELHDRHCGSACCEGIDQTGVSPE